MPFRPTPIAVALASLSSYMRRACDGLDSKRSTGPALRIFRYLKTSQRRTKIEVVGTRSHTPPGTSERVPSCTPSTSLLSRLPRLREASRSPKASDVLELSLWWPILTAYGPIMIAYDDIRFARASHMLTRPAIDSAPRFSRSDAISLMKGRLHPFKLSVSW